MKDWSKLEGKKIIVITHREVCTSVIVGCDPDIGICIADIGEEHDPWYVCSGPSAPGLSSCHKEDWRRKRKLELEGIVKMLQSGYYSIFEDKNREVEIWGRTLGNSWSASCPFSS